MGFQESTLPWCCKDMTVEKLTIAFKFIEPLFWLAQALIALNLLCPKFFFERNLKVINWLLRCQGFTTQLSSEDKAFKTWLRDLRILFFLNPLIIVLIHII